MLKDRSIQIRLIREPALTRATAQQRPQPATWTPEVVSALIQDQVQTILFSAGAVYVMKVAVDTISEVILKKTRDKNIRYSRPL